MTAPSSTPGRAYQGYPYSNPLVIDVPSIDSVTASTWANLPRNPIIPGQSASRNIPDTRIQNENRENRNLDTNSTCNQRDTSNVKLEPDVADYPVVYIDFPTNEMGEYVGSDNRREDSGISSNNPRNEQSNFVQDTIFYDPFEDRRIDVVQSRPTTPGAATAETHSLSDLSTQQQPSGSSGLGGSSSPLHPGHPFRSKETQVYTPRPRVDDSFLQSTIPASQFPAPPPAYTEIDRTSDQPPPPPRTEVILPENTCPARKLVSCNFCGQRVYTLAIKQNGALTHVLAFLFIFVCAPLVILVYCTDFFKYRNHYCPNCNKLVGYEVPILCQGMVYTKSS